MVGGSCCYVRHGPLMPNKLSVFSWDICRQVKMFVVIKSCK
jgi:hypothetical protein